MIEMVVISLWYGLIAVVFSHLIVSAVLEYEERMRRLKASRNTLAVVLTGMSLLWPATIVLTLIVAFVNGLEDD